MGPHIISIGIAVFLAVALTASEALALFYRDDRVNSLVQFVRVHGVAPAMAALLAAAVCVFASAAVTAHSIQAARENHEPCRVDDLANRSFVGAWRGRTAILRIIEPRVVGNFVVFEYDLTRAGEPVRGTGSIQRSTCDAELSSFDSGGRLVREHERLVLKSVEPAWQLTAAAVREAP